MRQLDLKAERELAARVVATRDKYTNCSLLEAVQSYKGNSCKGEACYPNYLDAP
jgi:hypothetical protein